MNAYFNHDSFNLLNINSSDMDVLKSLNNFEIELLLTNPPIQQEGVLHRPMVQEFKTNQELIFSGCSETQGNYLCGQDDSDEMYKSLWGFRLSNELIMDAINLGIGGESAYRIIQRLFSHFKKYGNPKNLFCLFPDPYRFTSPQQNGYLMAKRPYGGDFLQTTHHNYGTVPHNVMYAKRPFMKEDVVSQSLPLFFNFQAISNLEHYCKELNINFLWGSWHKETNYIAKIINNNTSNYYENFVDLSPNDYTVTNKYCHKDLYDFSPDLYESGSDNWHLGTHGHVHIADKFLKEYNSRFTLNE